MTAPVVVVGGGPAGHATALAIAERGIPVRLLERSGPPPAGPAAKAAELWHRPTVPQAAHSHILTCLGVRVLRRHAPRLLDTALEQGARLLDLTTAAPAPGGHDRHDAPGGHDGHTGHDGPSEDPWAAADHELAALAIRRPLLDLLLQRAARAVPGVEAEYGTGVRGLLLDPSRSRVTGVVTDTGVRMPAAFVVDATGRRAASATWLDRAGIPAGADLTAPTRLRCFTRFYRLRAPDGALPGALNRGNAAGGIWDHYAAVVHPADNGVFAVSIGVPTTDPATDALREPAGFTAAARLSPYVAEWVDAQVATALTDVRVIASPPNILRGAIRPGGPAVTGLFPVGDAACVTDPLYGRGLSLSLQHAFALAELIGTHRQAGEELSERAALLSAGIHRPWYDQAARDSLHRIRQWQAATRGTAPEPGRGPGAGARVPEPGQAPAPARARPSAPRGSAPASAPAPEGQVPPAVPGRPALAEVARAAAGDRTVWRGLVRVLMGLDTPTAVFDADWFRRRVRAGAGVPVPAGRRPPGRAELLAALAAARVPR